MQDRILSDAEDIASNYCFFFHGKVGRYRYKSFYNVQEFVIQLTATRDVTFDRTLEQKSGIS